jgi:Flp pilus assembly protein TadG
MSVFTVKRRTTKRRRGSVLVESALVLPAVIIFLFGIFEYGRYLMTMQLLSNATREACRYAVSHTQSVIINGVTYGNNTSDVTNKFTSMMGGTTISGQSVTVYRSNSVGSNLGTWTNAQPGECICVRVTGNYQVATPTLLFMSSTIPVDIKSVMRTESN